MGRPTRITIDAGALQHNLALVREAAPDSRVVACVKANGYGHGAVESAHAFAGADLLGVAGIDEALQLRAAGIEQPLLLLEGFFHTDELDEIARHGFECVIHSPEQLQRLCEWRGALPRVWLKLDTGMHRLGLDADAIPGAILQLKERGCPAPVAMTHFARAEELEEPFTAQQIQRFDAAFAGSGLPASLANSAAILAWPETHRDWVRPGFMLYGNSPLAGSNPVADRLRPAMTFSTEIVSVRRIAAGEGVGYNHAWIAARESTVAVAAVGYGDGYPRNTANGCPVLVDGREARTVGHVSMDLLIIDVSDIGPIRVGDPVELWGPNLSVNRVAKHSGYSAYELLTRLPVRAARSYA